MSNRDPDSVDWLDLRPDPDEGKPRPDPRRRYLWYGGAAALVVALLLTRTQHGMNQAAAPARSPAPIVSSSSASSSTSAPASTGSFVNPTAVVTPSPSVPVQVTSVGHRLLDVPADWELFARGEDSVVRIQLALGRVTITTVPVTNLNTSAVFVVGADRVIVRPMDDVAASVVRDGKPAADLPQSLQQGFMLLPGPDSRHMWAQLNNGLALVTLDGTPTGATIDVPASGSVMGPDGAGYVLLTGFAGGAYEAKPGAVHRITNGVLLASGPTRWLATECDDSLTCALVVIDRASGARHALDTAVEWYNPTQGLISPDGKTAALQHPDDGVSAGLDLLDLESGLQRPALATLHSSDGAGPSFVWSPDSRRIFAVDNAQRVIMIDRNTGRTTPLGVQLPRVTQLALRHRTS